MEVFSSIWRMVQWGKEGFSKLMADYLFFRMCVILDRALNWEPGDIDSIPIFATGLQGNLGQITSLLCANFTIFKMGIIMLTCFIKHY